MHKAEGPAWLLPALAGLLVVLHVAHATGLRNLLALLLTLAAAVLLLRARHWPPLGGVLLAWLVFGALSAAWSVDAEATLKSVLYDIALPTGVFYCAFLAARKPAAPTVVGVAGAAGLVFLAAMTVLAYSLGQADLLRNHEPGGALYFYPGPGAASTLAVYAVPPALLLALSRDSRDRWIGCLSLACVPLVGLGTLNRMFWLALAAAAVFFVLWQWQRFNEAQRRQIVVGMALGVLAAVATVAYLNAQRGEERRLMMWREWGAIAAEAPFVGYGFGKTAVAEIGGPRLSADIVQRDRHVLAHSHNLLLNVVLQVGVLGLALFGLLMAALFRTAARARDPSVRSSGAALAALVAAMLVKNTTDDVMDHAVVVAFWLYAGFLSGRILNARESARPSQSGTNASHPQ